MAGLKSLANDLASKGRNGDTMLMHIAPEEVAGLQALAKSMGGSLTTNPDTGLPEAFFFLAPMLGALGSGLGALGTGLATGLGTAGGALASGLGTLGSGIGSLLGLGGAGAGAAAPAIEGAVAAGAPTAAAVPTLGAPLAPGAMGAVPGMAGVGSLAPEALAGVTPGVLEAGAPVFSGTGLGASAVPGATVGALPSAAASVLPGAAETGGLFGLGAKDLAKYGLMAGSLYDTMQRRKDLKAARARSEAKTRSVQGRIAQNYQRQGRPMGYTFADGGRVDGPGDGMSDRVPAMIDGRQPAAMSDGEFVIPADVVSGIGNGSTNAGARELYDMMARIRQARTGSGRQAKQINAKKMMPK